MTPLRSLVTRQPILRFHAIGIALLYLFLCTFGVLSHDHALPEVALENTTYTSAECSTQTPHTTLHHHKTTSPGHCGFCEWQASSVSTALANAPQNTLSLISLEVVQLAIRLHTAPLLNRSARAPPLA